MHASLFNHLRRSLPRQIMVWVVVLVLPINGLSGVLLRLLGPQHRHAPVVHGQEAGAAWTLRGIAEHFIDPGTMAIMDGFHAHQQWHDHRHPVEGDFHPHVQELDKDEVHEHTHAHNAFERHRHDSKDGSVIPMGPTESGQDGPGAAVAGMDFGGALAIPITWPDVLAMSSERLAWGMTALAPWHSHVSAPLERPPRC